MDNTDNSLVSRIYSAIEDKQFYPVVQPIIDVRTNQLHSAEVLARWKEMSANDMFLHADRIKVGHKISLSVLEQACGHCAPLFPLNFNLSPVQLGHEDTIPLLKRIIEDKGYPAHLITLEITEDPFPQHCKRAILDNAITLQRMGIKLSLDDYGVGHQNASRLLELPISQIKVDRVFIERIHQDPMKQDMVQHFLMFTKRHGIEAVMEGVETKQESEYLAKIGGNIQQGYLHSYPLALSEFTEIYKTVTRKNDILVNIGL
ncbi:EAL domain-containing protein [Vibrio sp. Hal054]|uniref:EAL domain-containing protein n=1 Tax=Vibrio sp. Hal054 TaxID=3035158 RepID=UPI00301E2DF3